MKLIGNHCKNELKNITLIFLQTWNSSTQWSPNTTCVIDNRPNRKTIINNENEDMSNKARYRNTRNFYLEKLPVTGYEDTNDPIKFPIPKKSLNRSKYFL